MIAASTGQLVEDTVHMTFAMLGYVASPIEHGRTIVPQDMFGSSWLAFFLEVGEGALAMTHHEPPGCCTWSLGCYWRLGFELVIPESLRVPL